MSHLKKILALMLTFALMLSCTQSLPRGKVVDVDRGDVLMVPRTFTDRYSRAVKFRLLAVKCPDPYSNNLLDAYYGSKAKKFSERWCHSRYVVLERPLKTGSLMMKRLGFVRDYRNGRYLHEALLEAGLARADFQGRSFGEKDGMIIKLEAQAKKKLLGMWSKTHPEEHVMRAAVNDSKSLLKKFTSSLSAPVTRSKTVVVQEKAVTKPKSFAGKRFLIREQIVKIHHRHVTWKKSRQIKRLAGSEALRKDLRALKIEIMDFSDEYSDKLSAAQKNNLKKTREDLSQLMKEVKKFIGDN